MKKYLLVRFILMSTSAIFFSSVYPQTSSDTPAVIEKKSGTSASTFGAAKDADKIALAGLKAVNAKMYNHFSRTYKKATDIRVRPVKENTHIVFKVDGIQNGVQYNKKGKWLHSIRYFDESKLPGSVRTMVEAAYPGFTIFGAVVEIKVYNKTALLVMIENAKTWRRIRIVDAEMDIYEDYLKP